LSNYEGLFILSPELQDEALEKETDFVKNEIVKQRAEISESKILGKRNLAYAIKKMREGIYLLINFNSRPEVIENILSKIRLNSQILRANIFSKEKGSLLNEIKD